MEEEIPAFHRQSQNLWILMALHYPGSKEVIRLESTGKKRREERVRNSLGMNAERI